MHLSPPCIYVCPLCMDMCSLFLAYTLSEFHSISTIWHRAHESLSLHYLQWDEQTNLSHYDVVLGSVRLRQHWFLVTVVSQPPFCGAKNSGKTVLDIKKNSAAFGRGFKFFRPIGKILICLPYKCSGTWGTDRHRCGKFGDQAACLWYKIDTWPGCFRSRVLEQSFHQELFLDELVLLVGWTPKFTLWNNHSIRSFF